MRSFESWCESYDYGNLDCMEFAEDAFKAGMLAAADLLTDSKSPAHACISELAKEFILPADELADLIAKQIREYADDD